MNLENTDLLNQSAGISGITTNSATNTEPVPFKKVYLPREHRKETAKDEEIKLIPLTQFLEDSPPENDGYLVGNLWKNIEEINDEIY